MEEIIILCIIQWLNQPDGLAVNGLNRFTDT